MKRTLSKKDVKTSNLIKILYLNEIKFAEKYYMFEENRNNSSTLQSQIFAMACFCKSDFKVSYVANFLLIIDFQRKYMDLILQI